MFVKINPNVAEHKPVSHGGLFPFVTSNSNVLDFSSNISPLGPPPLVRKTIKKQLKTIEIYPDPDSIRIRKNLEWYTKVPFNQIVVGNGATEIIYNFCQAFLSQKTPVLIPIPTFGEYEAAAKLNGAKISFFKTMNLNENDADFINKIPKHGCVFLCNPNNPTGVLIPRKKLLNLLRVAKNRRSILVVDECFIELVPESNESVVKDIKKHDNLLVLRSLTKSFGLAGIRIGYALGSKQMISVLNKIKIPWNVSGLAQQAASAALCHSFFLEKANNLIKKESNYLQKNISKIDGFECLSSSTNFILIKTKINSKTLQKKLLKKKILIRNCSTFRGLDNKFIRIAVRTRKENKRLVRSLEKI